MKALSLTQPMAWAIFHGKDIENRTWRTPYRGRFYVHASKGFDQQHYNWLLLNQKFLGIENLPAKEDFVHGAIIGEVDIISMVDESDSPWFFGPIGFVLRNPVEYETPIPCKGKLGFFTPDIGGIG